MITMSINGSILIVFIIIVRSLIYHRVSKKTFQILWGIAIAALIVPFSIPIFNKLFSSGDTSNQNSSVQRIFREVNVSLNANIGSSSQAWSLKESLVILYGCIVVILFCYLVYAYFKSMKPINEAILSNSKLINEWCKKQNFQLKRTVNVYISDRIQTPITTGVIHPKIILPADLDFKNQTNIECMLTHEMTHIKNNDVAKKYFLLFVTVLHFFNPFVWIMYTLFNRDIETYCDEKTISELGESQRRTYALCLLNYIEQKQKDIVFQQAFAKNAIEERIESIMKRPRKGNKLISTTIVAVILGVFIVVTSFNAQASFNESKTISVKQSNLISQDKLGDVKNVMPAQLKKEIATFENQKKQLISSGTLTEKTYNQSLNDMKSILKDIEAGKTLIDDGNKSYGEAESDYQDSEAVLIDGIEISAKTENELNQKVKAYLAQQVEEGNMTQKVAEEKGRALNVSD